MASNSIFKQFVLDVLSIWGLGTQAGGAAAQAKITALRNESFAGQQSAVLSPQEAATAVVKNETTGLDMASEAAQGGISGARFAALVAIAGNPPGPETLLEMLNRGIISLDDVGQGLRQGYLKDSWIGAYEALRFRPLTGPEAIEAAVQGQLADSDARALWAANGIDPEWYDTAFGTAGNPPGPGETLTMLNRGIFSEADATQALKESRLKDKYIPQFLQLARRRIPFRTLNTLVKNKAISVEYALTQLEQLGYTEADAQALIKSATTASATGHHTLTEAQIVASYEAHASTAAEATAHLVALGYDAADAAAILQLGDVRATLKLRDQVVTALRSRFVGHRIDEVQARADLATAGVPGDQQDQLINLWKIEQVANPRELTEVQVRHMVEANLLTVSDYTARMVAMGYTQGDAALLTQLNFPTPTGGTSGTT